jgi:hypothetical protein
MNASDSLVLNTAASSKYININSSSHMASQSLPNTKAISGIRSANYQQLQDTSNYVPVSTPPSLPQNQRSSPQRSIPKNYVHSSPTKTQNSSARPQMEEINGSDYVCMAGGTLTKKLQQAQSVTLPPPKILAPKPRPQRQESTITSLAQAIPNPQQVNKPITQYAALEPKPMMQNPVCLPKQHSPKQNSPSPTPSQTSSGSGKIRGFKNLLPYTVTARSQGPTEAERKIEELTRQLEEEIEKNEEQGEYFGEFFFDLISQELSNRVPLLFRNLSHLQRESNRGWPSVSSHGKSLSYKLLHLLLLWPSFERKSFL